MIVIDGNEDEKKQVLYDSSVILKTFAPELYPEPIKSQVEEMEANLGSRLGPALRCHAYFHYLTNLNKFHQSFVKLVADERKVAKIENIVTDKFLDKGLSDGILEALSITEEAAEASAQTMRDVFAEASKQLEESGREYLLDTKTESFGFTAADLTLAALSYPYIKPKEMNFWVSDPADTPDQVNELADELRATPAGQHVLKIYEKHRIVGTDDGEVTMKHAKRDKYPWQKLSWFSKVSFSGIAIAGLLYAFLPSHRLKLGHR